LVHWRESDRTYQSQIKSLLNKVSVSAAVPDYLLTYMPLSICWFVDHKDRPGLLLNRMSILEDFNYSEYFSEFNKEPSPLMPYGLFLTTTPTKIFEIYLQIKEADSEAPGKIRISKSFENWVHKTQAAQGLLLKAKRYRGLKDYQLNLNNSELEQKLFPHQRVGVAWLLENKFAFLGDDMGLGKTLTVLTAFDELRTKGQSKFLLLIAPASLVKNWMREQVRWVPQLKLCACPDNKKDREALLSKIARDHTGIYDGLVINYEAARIAASAERLREIAESRDVFLCLDESQRIKNARSVGFKSIAHFALACSRRVLLSGTPTPKDISDIWSQYYVLDGGERFGSNFYDWLNSIAVLGNRWSDFAVKTFKPEAVAKVKDQAQELLLRRRKNEVVDLPEKIYSIRDVELKAEQFKRYEELRQDLLVRVTRASGAEFYKEISGILEEYLRAVQIASNPRLVDPNWKGEPAKFLELDEIVNEVVQEQGQKLVIWTNFLVNVAELTKRYAAFGAVAFSGEVSQVDRDRAVQEFQSDSPNSPKVLVAVPAAGGVGITLTAAQTAVYVDKTWNAEHWMQKR
jgi:SWI/SNF-related matrix-associated actin-dependent regulator 1 of chromatin subfamily A